jgi:hypothetical protein
MDATLIDLATKNLCDVEDALIAVRDGDAAKAETLLDNSVNELAVMLDAVEQSAGSPVSQPETEAKPRIDEVESLAIMIWAFMNEHFDECIMAAYGVAARDDDPCDCTSSVHRKVRDLAIDMLIGDALPDGYIKDDGSPR